MKTAFEPDDLMTILDGIDDAVGQGNFAAMNQAAASFYQRLGLDPQHIKGKSGKYSQNSKALWLNANYVR